MKKIFLLSLISCISLFGFTSAGRVSDCEINTCSFSVDNSNGFSEYVSSMTEDFVNFGVRYSPSSIYISSSDGTVECSNGFCTVFGLYDYGGRLSFYTCDEIDSSVCGIDGLSLSNCAYVSDSCTLTWEEEGGTEGGNNGGGLVDSTGPIIQNGFAEFTPVIEGVFDITGELIPYVVYLGIGILVVILGFVAIKRLMNWMSGKVTSNFSSRRRK